MKLFGSSPDREIQKQIVALRRWDEQHFPVEGYQHDVCFRSDSGTQISISGVTLPAPSFMQGQPFGLKQQLRHLLRGAAQSGVLLSDVVQYLRKELQLAVTGYQDNKVKRRKLSREQRSDPLLQRIDDVFKEHLNSLLLELQFFQPERHQDQGYLLTLAERLHVIIMQMFQLNRACSQFMYLLTKSALTDTAADQNAILITVETMENTLRSTLTIQ